MFCTECFGLACATPLSRPAQAPPTKRNRETLPVNETKLSRASDQNLPSLDRQTDKKTLGLTGSGSGSTAAPPSIDRDRAPQLTGMTTPVLWPSTTARAQQQHE